MLVESRVTRLFASATLLGSVAAAVIAATPAPVAAPPPAAKLVELDEVLVIPRNVLPLKDFLNLPRYGSVALSPSGTRLAVGWVANEVDYRLLVGLNELPSMKSLNTTALGAEYNGSDLSFANENRLLLQTNWRTRGLRRLHEPVGMLMTTDLDGGKPHYINREAVSAGDPLAMQRRDEEEVAATARAYDADQASISTRDSLGPVRFISRVAGKPEQLLIQTTRANQRSGSTAGTGAYLYNLRDNKQTQVATLPLSGAQLVTGPEARVALATGVNARNETVVYYLPENVRAGGKAWQLLTSSPAGERGLRPIAWTGSGEEYYALDGRNLPDARGGHLECAHQHAAGAVSPCQCGHGPFRARPLRQAVDVPRQGAVAGVLVSGPGTPAGATASLGGAQGTGRAGGDHQRNR